MPGAVKAFDELLENTPRILAFLSFVILTLAVAHEWGYFQVVGAQFLPLMSPTDYLISALFWLPLVVCSWFASDVIKVAWRRATNFADVEVRTLGDTVRFKPDRFKIVKVPVFVFLGFMLFAAGYEVLYDESNLNTVLFMAGYTFWVAFIIWVFSHERMADRFTWLQLYGVGLAPVFLLFSFWIGRADGHVAIASFDNVYVLKLKDDPEVKHLTVLRNLSRGVLVRDQSAGRIVFHKWEDISQFSHHASASGARSFGCKLIGYYCQPQNIP